MAGDITYKPQTHWERTAFDALAATWTSERIEADQALLDEISKLAENCPLLKEALDWAQKHDIRFFIDRQARDINGYYTPGAGVLGIGSNILSNPGDAITTLVHEIRHAWQDHYRFIASNPEDAPPDPFRPHFINTVLMEADATAFGERARDQYRAFLIKKEGREIPQKLQDSLANEEADLGEKFAAWIKLRWRTEAYGDDLSREFGGKWGIAKYDDLNGERVEFEAAVPQARGINLDNLQDILRLGVNFAGNKNYLAKLQPDFLPKILLRPSLADTFWGFAKPEQIKLTSDLRKEHLKERLAQRKKKPKSPQR